MGAVIFFSHFFKKARVDIQHIEPDMRVVGLRGGMILVILVEFTGRMSAGMSKTVCRMKLCLNISIILFIFDKIRTDWKKRNWQCDDEGFSFHLSLFKKVKLGLLTQKFISALMYSFLRSMCSFII